MQCNLDGFSVVGFFLIAGFIAVMGGALSKKAEQRSAAWYAAFVISGVGMFLAVMTRC